MATANRSRSRSRDRTDTANKPPTKRVFIANIPYDARWQDIKDLFRQEVGEVSFVELFNDENDRPKGCGVIEFDSPATAKKAVDKMHRYEMSGRKIICKEDYDYVREKRPMGNGAGGGRAGRDMDRGNWDRSGGGGGGGNWVDGRDEMVNVGPGGKANYGNTFGLSTNFLESLGIDGPLITKVFIGNLDFRVDDKKLKEVFRLAGRVLSGEVNRDKEGKSRGHGVVEFEHPVEAVQAISMFNSQQLFDRPMHVKLDRLSDPFADLARNKLPEGLKSIGRGLKPDGSPLTNVSSQMAGQSGPNSNQNSSINQSSTLSAINNLATQLAAQQAVIAAGMNTMGSGATQLAGGTAVIPASTIPMGLTNVSTTGLQANVGAMANPVSTGMGSGNVQQQQYQNSGAGNQGSNTTVGSNSAGYRDEYNNYGGTGQYNQQQASNFPSYPQDNKPKYGNGVAAGQAGMNMRQGRSNTVIITNLPPSCTWQTLKSKFRECGEVVFAEKRDSNTGIVRFSNDRDAETAVNVFDQSRVDGRTVDVRFL